MIPLFKVFMSPLAAKAATRVLNSGFIGQGPEVDAFEAELAEYTHAYPVATASCTSAIHMVLTHLGVGPGDEVITTPLTCVATNAPIVSLGARPVWADVDMLTGLIQPDDVAAKITRRTKAIIAVDWTGRRCDYRALKQHGIPVIEDAAHGPLFQQGERGDYVCYSFGPIKHLTSGDGGAVVTPCAKDREALKLLRWYGLDRTSRKDFRCEQDIEVPGLKWHMNDINAAIGRENLLFLPRLVEAHQMNARELFTQLAEVDIGLLCPDFSEESNYWVFPMLITTGIRDEFKRYMEGSGVMVSQVHARNDKHTAYDYDSGPLFGAASFVSQQINIPCGWWLSPEDINRIVSAIKSWRPS